MSPTGPHGLALQFVFNNIQKIIIIIIIMHWILCMEKCPMHMYFITLFCLEKNEEKDKNVGKPEKLNMASYAKSIRKT